MSTSTRNRLAICAACLLTLTTLTLRADQLQMQNGDRYAGKILSVNSNSIVLESDVLGKVTLPRSKVAALTFGAGTSTNTAQTLLNSLASTAPASKTAKPDSSAALHDLNANTNFVQQVRQLMLVDADPASKQKYDDLVGGLMSGKLNLSDLRNEAKSSIDKINQIKHQQGAEADASLDTYLAILEEFVNATPATTPATISPASPAPAASFGTNSARVTPGK